MTGHSLPASGAGVMPLRSRGRAPVGALAPSVFFVAADAAALVVAYGVLALIMPLVLGADAVGRAFIDPTTTEAMTSLMKFAGLFLFLLLFGGLYHQKSWEVEEVSRLFAGVGLTVVVATVFQPEFGFMDNWLVPVAAWAVLVGLTLTFRMMTRALTPVRRAMGEPLIMIGRGMTSSELGMQLRESRAFRSDILAQYGCEEFQRLLGASPSVGVTGCAESFGRRPRDMTFVLVPSPEEMPHVSDLLESLSDADVSYMVAVPFFGLARRTVTLRKVMGGDVVFADVHARRSTGLSLLAKRAVDIAGATTALLMLSPILLTIYALLSMERGPVFFSQKRVGKGRTRFDCYKFRTMVPDAEERLERYLAQNPDARREWDAYQKLAKDPRVTAIGRFLRKSSMDELPQLLNVLRGEMSLVGPRPIVAPEVPGYPSDRAYYNSPGFDYYARVRPGITGMWQVSGRASTTHDERIRLDRWYARNWSIWLDIVIVLKTFRAAILGTGSS